MIVCRRCGAENDSSADFCGNCGVFLEWEGDRIEDPTPPPPVEEPAEAPGLIDRVRTAVRIVGNLETPASPTTPAPTSTPTPAVVTPREPPTPASAPAPAPVEPPAKPEAPAKPVEPAPTPEPRAKPEPPARPVEPPAKPEPPAKIVEPPATVVEPPAEPEPAPPVEPPAKAAPPPKAESKAPAKAAAPRARRRGAPLQAGPDPKEEAVARAEAAARAAEEAIAAAAARAEAEARAAVAREAAEAKAEAAAEAAAEAERVRKAALLRARPVVRRAQPPEPPAPPTRPGPTATPPAAAAPRPTEPDTTDPPSTEVAARLPGQTTPRRGRRVQATPDEPIRPGELVCGDCGVGNDPARKFCRRCGASLVAAVVAPTPWWRRLFRRRRRVTLAGERPSRRSSSTAPGQSGGRRVRRVFRNAQGMAGRARRVLAILAALGLVTVMVGPWRDKVTGPVTDAFHSIKRKVSPEYEAIHPTAATATTETAGGPPGLLIDGASNTAWEATTSGAEGTQIIHFEFAEPVDIRKIGITPGRSDVDEDFLLGARPQLVHVVTSTGGGKDLHVPDTPGFHSFGIHADDVTSIDLQIAKVYPSASGQNLAIAEVEFFRTR